MIAVFALLLLILLSGIFYEFMIAAPWMFALVIAVPSLIFGTKAARVTKNEGPNSLIFAASLFFVGWFGLRALFAWIERLFET